MKKVFYEIKWALQRLFRGWDDRAANDIAGWLSDTLPDMIEYMINNLWTYPTDGFIDPAVGVPTDEEDIANMEKWKQILQDIADGFREFSFENLCREYVEEDYKMEKFHKGMELFVKYFGELWN